MLPAVLKWNAAVDGNTEKQNLVAKALGSPDKSAAQAVGDLVASLGLPTRLSDVGITSEAFDDIAEGALLTPWVPKNPRTISAAKNVMQILEIAQ